MKSFLDKKYSHLIILAALLVGAIVGFLILRSFFVPDSFYSKGHYRATAIVDEVERGPKIQGNERCQDCHFEKVNSLWLKSRHAKVECENCHQNGKEHVWAGGGRKVHITVTKNNSGCLVCHNKTTGRPKSFPQIVNSEHHNEKEGEARCIACHNPHSPMETKDGEKIRKSSWN